MKKILVCLLSVSMIACLCACGGDEVASMDSPQKIQDYVVDFGTITEFDESAAQEILADKYLGGGACTCVVKEQDGSCLVGRNMDLNLTENPAFKFVLDINEYKAIGIGYSPSADMPTEQVLEEGVDSKLQSYLPAIATDFLNEEGLYIQTNMRNEEEGYACSGTNPDAEERVYVTSLPSYIATRCATVEEAVELAKSVNLYTPVKGVTWNFAFTIADAEGNYGLLEIAKNKVCFNEGQNGQANFYVTPEFAAGSKWGVGQSRFEVVNEGLDEVTDQDAMLEQMTKAYYSQTYDYENFDKAKFDIRTENTHTFPVNAQGEYDPENGTIENCTYDWVMDESRKDEVMELCVEDCTNNFGEYHNSGAGFDWAGIRANNKDLDDFWVTAYSIAVDCKNKTLKVNFWEDTENTVSFGFDS